MSCLKSEFSALKGRTDAESFISKSIGADTDIPAGDIGVTAREVGWLFDTYKAETSLWEGCITGKGRPLGGSLMKPEATGYGLIYVSLWLFSSNVC